MANLPPLNQGHLSVFEGYWGQLDKAGSGKLDGGTAARFLKGSQLREPVLHKIWNLSDPGGKGYLDKPGFFMALRLIATCQNGKEPTISSITATDPAPKLAGMEGAGMKSSVSKWTVEMEERAKFEVMFQQLQPVGGLLSGDKVKPIMMGTKLHVEALKNIWNLADIDQDGKMDKEEFVVAMKLITLVQSGEVLPQTLPPSLIPASKMKGVIPATVPGVGGVSPAVSAMGGVLPSLATTTLSGNSSPRPSPSPITGSPFLAKKEVTASGSSEDLAKEGWIITSDVKTKYDSYFAGIDKDHDGFVSGDEARGLFMASNLPPNLLGHIWNLCDITKTGCLNSEQFALAMFIIAEKVRGKEVPTELAPNMIPPSLRKTVQQRQQLQQAPPTSTTPIFSGAPLSSVAWTMPTTTPLLATTVTSVATTTPMASAWPASNTSASNLDPSAAVGEGFASDFSAIKELDTITNEIEEIRQDKTQLSEGIVAKQKLIQERKGELEQLQGDVDMATRQREDLERDKAEAQNKLDQLDSEKARFESQMAELKQKCQDEREEIERLKSQLAEQETSKKVQSEELEKLREQLESLKREEREYKMKVDISSADLERVQKTNQNIHNEMSRVRQKIDLLKEEHQTLNNELSLYPPVSTATSSVININDVGQLSAELTVPHVLEPDAISARATAGSSSPVSSISGFSTNSHLDDGGDESSVGSKDPTQHQQPSHDPFASVTSGNDPFAAFSLPSADPFFPPTSGGSKFTGKPSLLSAFDPLGGSDPFGSSDPFKSSPGGGSGGVGGTSSDDPFRTDPFGSSSSVPSAVAGAGDTPGSLGGSSTDPFSGQDPFTTDPFASSPTAIKESSSPWGSTSPFPVVDPFNSQQKPQTPTDPFGSSDPFGDDPFGSKSRTDEAVNPFLATSAPAGVGGRKAAKREEIVVPDRLPKPGPGATNKERVAWAKRDSEREEALRKLREYKEEEDLARAIKESMAT